MERIQISPSLDENRPSSSPAVVPWLRQLVASNHVGAPRRTISLSNHSPHGHIAPKVAAWPILPAAKHIPSRKKLRLVGWSAKRYYHSLGVLCNQRLICPRPVRAPRTNLSTTAGADKLTNSNSASGSDHYGGMTRALSKICHSDYLLV